MPLMSSSEDKTGVKLIIIVILFITSNWLDAALALRISFKLDKFKLQCQFINGQDAFTQKRDRQRP